MWTSTDGRQPLLRTGEAPPGPSFPGLSNRTGNYERLASADPVEDARNPDRPRSRRGNRRRRDASAPESSAGPMRWGLLGPSNYQLLSSSEDDPVAEFVAERRVARARAGSTGPQRRARSDRQAEASQAPPQVAAPHRAPHTQITLPRIRSAMASKDIQSFLPCANCCIAAPEDMFVAVERFGRFDGILDPGFTYVGFDICGCCIRYRSLSRRVEQNTCKVKTQTQDNTFVTISIAVQQLVDPGRAQEAMYSLADKYNQMDSHVAHIVRSEVRMMTLDEVFERMGEVAEKVRAQLHVAMAPFGIEVVGVCIPCLVPDQEVVDAMNEIMRQKMLRDATILGAEAEKVRVQKQAEADADAAQLKGEGIARRRTAIARGFQDSGLVGGNGTESVADELRQLLLMSEYFTTLREIAGRESAEVVFIPPGAPMQAQMGMPTLMGMGSVGLAAASVPEQVCMEPALPALVDLEALPSSAPAAKELFKKYEHVLAAGLEPREVQTLHTCFNFAQVVSEAEDAEKADLLLEEEDVPRQAAATAEAPAAAGFHMLPSVGTWLRFHVTDDDRVEDHRQ